MEHEFDLVLRDADVCTASDRFRADIGIRVVQSAAEQRQIGRTGQLRQRLAGVIPVFGVRGLGELAQPGDPLGALGGRCVHGHCADNLNLGGRIPRLGGGRGHKGVLRGRRDRREVANRVSCRAADASIRG